MLLFQLGLLLILLVVCSFAPGFYFLRKLRWSPLEKLCGSVGLSLILLYLASWAVYCFGERGHDMPVHAAPFVVVSLACLAAAAVCWKDIDRLARAKSVRQVLAGFGFLTIWTAVLMATIRNYSGAGWYGDWLEHFQRSLFFLRHFPADTPIFSGYSLPARPPMMNVLAGFFLAQTADRFELFQVVFAFLNLLLFLPCCLIMPVFGGRAKRRTWLLAMLFAAGPVVIENITYSWTKALAAFYVVLALWFYLAGWRKRNRVRTTAAFVALAGGLLVHYSAGPYVAVLTLHYLLCVFPKRQQKWRELAGIAAICGLLLSTWLLWSVAVYGADVTFASNTSVTSSQKYTGSTWWKIASNLFDTLVPAVARDPALLRQFDQPNFAGRLRDWAFLFYQVNAIFGMGLVGGPLILWLMYRAFRWKRKEPDARPPVRAKRRVGEASAFRRKRKEPDARPLARGKGMSGEVPERTAGAPELRFWQILIAGCLFLGVAVVGERDLFGSAHLTLLSLQALGLSMLAAVIPWRRRSLAILLLAGCAVDFSLGVLLQARVESLENTAQRTVFPPLVVVGGALQIAAPGAEGLSDLAWYNWYRKHQYALDQSWFREVDRRSGKDPTLQNILPRMSDLLKRDRSEDASLWQGWYGRHGGEMEFLGDHAAGSSGARTTVATALLSMLFLGLAATVFQRTG